MARNTESGSEWSLQQIQGRGQVTWLRVKAANSRTSHVLHMGQIFVRGLGRNYLEITRVRAATTHLLSYVECEHGHTGERCRGWPDLRWQGREEKNPQKRWRCSEHALAESGCATGRDWKIYRMETSERENRQRSKVAHLQKTAEKQTRASQALPFWNLMLNINPLTASPKRLMSILTASSLCKRIHYPGYPGWRNGLSPSLLLPIHATESGVFLWNGSRVHSCLIPVAIT